MRASIELLRTRRIQKTKQNQPKIDVINDIYNNKVYIRIDRFKLQIEQVFCKLKLIDCIKRSKIDLWCARLSFLIATFILLLVFFGAAVAAACAKHSITFDGLCYFFSPLSAYRKLDNKWYSLSIFRINCISLHHKQFNRILESSFFFSCNLNHRRRTLIKTFE